MILLTSNLETVSCC